MKNITIITLLLFFTTQGQEQIKDIKIGDILTLGAPSAKSYRYINFPKTNFIIKKGGIANYKAIAGNRIIVTEVNGLDGYTKIIFKREDGIKFFNSKTLVSANLEKAVEKKEILLESLHALQH